MILLLLVAQVTGEAPIDIGQALVSYGIAAPLVAWLIWQLRSDRADHAADTASLRTQLDAERAANRDLWERIIAQQERMAPILEQAARALDHAVERR